MSCKPEVNVYSLVKLLPWTSFSSSSSSLPMKEDVLKMTQTTTTSKTKIFFKYFCLIYGVPQPQTAPLTILYNGEVIVFNDFSAEKAKEVMDLASKGTANTFTGFTCTVNLPKSQTEVRTNIAPTSNQVPHLIKTATQEPIMSSSAAMACFLTNILSFLTELPIARRASLHRFLAKRKDRVTSKAPYQLSDPAKASSKTQTGDNTISWLGLAAQI
ncbi:hypothetical protein Bca4012_072901 [Brassica carinata]|uniref:Protein TIFY n=1 Tax=Brassica carinata TaxID=52824 RepID=A0A8X7U9S9_BRACI|nr:hypothetical protein Bca52824_065244 [Brassica carinata]